MVYIIWSLLFYNYIVNEYSWKNHFNFVFDNLIIIWLVLLMFFKQLQVSRTLNGISNIMDNRQNKEIVVQWTLSR